MADVSDALYRETVEEWTDWLCHDEDFAGLRTALTAKGFEPSRIILAAYLEDEFQMEYGAFLTEDGKIYDFSRSTEKLAPNVDTFKYEEMKDTAAAIEKYPEVKEALRMLSGKLNSPNGDDSRSQKALHDMESSP